MEGEGEAGRRRGKREEIKDGRERKWEGGKGRGEEERTVPIVPVLRKHHWYGTDHGAHTDTLHTGPDRASYVTV